MSQSTSDNVFPRTAQLPNQSPKYWVKEKDRYLRQLLIRDIQADTRRELVVYFTSDGIIDYQDAANLSEVLGDCRSSDVDLLIETPGGVVDACEKLISVLQLQLKSGYRVIVPGSSKSAGTVVALSATEIVMGVNSELGPIDPQFAGIPAEYIAEDPDQPFTIKSMARSAVLRMRRLATRVLGSGMLQGKPESDVESIVTKLSSAESYGSHGAVINAPEAQELGLNVNFLGPADELWKKLWLLYCLYDWDCRQLGYSKVYEGARISIAIPLPPSNNS